MSQPAEFPRYLDLPTELRLNITRCWLKELFTAHSDASREGRSGSLDNKDTVLVTYCVGKHPAEDIKEATLKVRLQLCSLLRSLFVSKEFLLEGLPTFVQKAGVLRILSAKYLDDRSQSSDTDGPQSFFHKIKRQILETIPTVHIHHYRWKVIEPAVLCALPGVLPNLGSIQFTRVEGGTLQQPCTRELVDAHRTIDKHHRDADHVNDYDALTHLSATMIRALALEYVSKFHARQYLWDFLEANPSIQCRAKCELRSMLLGCGFDEHGNGSRYEYVSLTTNIDLGNLSIWLPGLLKSLPTFADIEQYSDINMRTLELLTFTVRYDVIIWLP